MMNINNAKNSDCQRRNHSDGRHRLLAYERLNAVAITDAILCREGESVIVRSAFRWLRDGSVISNGYEMFDMEQICEDRGWQIVERYGDHIAIVSEASVREYSQK